MILRGDYLVTTWWLLVDYLVTTWWLLGDYLATTWQPLGDHLVTTSWPLGDYLVTTWWILGDQAVTTLWPLGDYLVTTWWPRGATCICDAVFPWYRCSSSSQPPLPSPPLLLSKSYAMKLLIGVKAPFGMRASHKTQIWKSRVLEELVKAWSSKNSLWCAGEVIE